MVENLQCRVARRNPSSAEASPFWMVDLTASRFRHSIRPSKATKTMSRLKRRITSIVCRSARQVESILRHKPLVEDYSQLKSILFLHYNFSLGTTVHATPLYEAMRAQMPNCKIAMATSGLSHQVFRSNPAFDVVFKTPDAGKDPRAAARAIRQNLHEWDVDLQCVATSSSNSRSYMALTSYLIGPYQRIGNAINPELYDRAVENPTNGNMIEASLQFMTVLGIEPQPFEPRVYFTAEELHQAKDILQAHALDNGRPNAIIVTQVSGSQPTQWYDDRFAQVAEDLHNRLGFNVIFVGAKNDEPRIAEIQSLVSVPSTSLAGKTDIPTLAAVLCLSDLCVTLDTGSLHVAWAVELPTVLIAAAWEDPNRWLPLRRPHIKILRRDVFRCEGCGAPSCTTRQCMDENTVEKVKAAIDEVLATYPPSEEARSKRVASSLNPAPPKLINLI